LEGGRANLVILCRFFLGVGGANFAVYTLWLPEQYRTECRGGIGAGIAHFKAIGTPVALTSLAFLVGILLLPWSVETKGEELPT
jgi:nitrate/nitrite transporter NarK